jgi:hypothetical protein
MPATARVAWQDVPFAKAPIWIVCGPIPPLTPENAARTLNNMAGHGPGTRVGLIPTAGTRHWKFDERPGDTAVDPDFTFDSTDITEMLVQLMRTSPQVPIWIATQGGDYLCMCVDHGIGDAHIVIELFTAMSQAGTYADFVPPLPGTMRAPLLSCFWNATKADAKGMWSDVVAVGKSIVGHERAAADHTGEEAHTESHVARTENETPTAVFVKSRVGFANELRDYRTRTKQTVSVTTLVARSLYHAFRDVGIKMADEILVTMDLRRYLSGNRWSLANLSSAASVPITPEMSAEEFTAAAFCEVASRKPLLRLMASASAARLKGLPAEKDVAHSARGFPSDGPLTLSLSDVSKIPASDKVAWKPGSEISDINLAIALPAAYPTYLSICMLNPVTDGAVHLTATFFGSRVDPELVREGLNKALETPGWPCAD